VHIQLDSPQGEEGEGTKGENLVDPRPRGPEDEAFDADLREQVAAAVAQLAERERIVITLYYYEELTLREIGEVLNVTESADLSAPEQGEPAAETVAPRSGLAS
jgi:RNA polymerase sigma factor (sigma-70 family)